MGEKETASAEDARVLKNKTKSNQSNDRMDAGDDGGDLDDDGAELDVSDRATWTSSNPGIGKATAQKPRAAYQGFRTAEPSGELPLDDAAINNTKSNIKN